jgi:hypothetical protein
MKRFFQLCLRFGFFPMILVLGSSSHAQKSPNEVRDRLNKIFYWQMADELKLSQEIEKSMTDFLESFQQKREEALLQRAEALKLLQKSPADANALLAYRKSLDQISKLDLDEYEQLNRLLGAEKLGRFLVVREEILQRLNAAFRQAKRDR